MLLHGTHVNMTLNWNALSPLLKNDGYCVFALNYGGLRFGQVGGTEPIEESGLELAEFVERVRMATGASEVDLVEHSHGKSSEHATLLVSVAAACEADASG